MKTSVKFLLAAALVLLASLTAYNMALRTAYRSGSFKDPLRDYTTLKFKDFNVVEVPAAGTIKVKIIAGPFGVRVHPGAAEVVHVSQQGQRLVITATFADHAHGLNNGETVVISCPRLAVLSTDASVLVQGRPQYNREVAPYARVLVLGFTQDSLALRQDRGSRVELLSNRLGLLRAQAGATPGSHSVLQLNTNNHLAAASLTLQSQSELVLDNVAIPQLRHQFGDSTKVTLTGAALSSALR